jgi:hypothetical protein
MKLNFLTPQSEIKLLAMFEDISVKPNRESPSPEGIVVSGHANGGVVIRQRSAAEDKGYVVVPPEQAESLIAAIRRYLKPGK